MSLIGHRYQAVPAVLETDNPKRHIRAIWDEFRPHASLLPYFVETKIYLLAKIGRLPSVLGIEHAAKVNHETCSFLPRSGFVQQANGADAVTGRCLGFSSVARAAHRRRSAYPPPRSGIPLLKEDDLTNA